MAKNYYGINKNQKMMANRGDHYVPQGFGKVVMMITAPAAILSMVSILLLFVLKGNAQGMAMIVALVSFAVSFIGSIILMIDVVRFNRKQSKKFDKPSEAKGLDIMRIVHMIIGIIGGIIIGYLIWGIK